MDLVWRDRGRSAGCAEATLESVVRVNSQEDAAAAITSRPGPK